MKTNTEEMLLPNSWQVADIIEFLPDATLAIDKDKRIIIWNKAIEKMTGIPAKEMLGKGDYAYTVPFYGDARPQLMDLVFLDNEEVESRYKNIKREDNTIMAEVFCPAMYNNKGAWIFVKAAPLHNQTGEVIGVIEIIRDITERRRAEEALSESEARFRRISNITSDIAYSCSDDFDGSLSIDWMSGAVESITGYTVLEITTQRCWRFLVLEEDQPIFDQNVIGLSPGCESSCEFRIRHKNGEIVWISSFAESMYDPKSHQKKMVYGGLLDITHRKKKEEEVQFLSYHDQLTGLYNRRFYEEELMRLDKERNLPISIAMGDVNGLKLINDSFGHAFGDEFLRKVSKVIKKGCRADDIVARLGGDEFVIILPKTNAFEAERVIRRIKSLASKEKFGAIDVSISFGFETKTKPEESIQDIFKKTEDHMYRHKLHENLSTRSKTIDLIMSTLYEKNNREMLHSKRVSEICEAISSMIYLDKDEIKQIRIAGLMHDIGKIGIDEKILNKPEKLSNDEWADMKRHPEIGYRILSSVNEFSEIAEYVLEHQERWDGKGYPRGLKGAEISKQSRIISIADAYDAMTSHRTYGTTLSEIEAIDEIKKCSGRQFDPDIAKIFVEMVLIKKW